MLHGIKRKLFSHLCGNKPVKIIAGIMQSHCIVHRIYYYHLDSCQHQYKDLDDFKWKWEYFLPIEEIDIKMHCI